MKDLKYRAICPLCGKAFDSREGELNVLKIIGTIQFGVVVMAPIRMKIMRLKPKNLRRSNIRISFRKIGQSATSCLYILIYMAAMHLMQMVVWH